MFTNEKRDYFKRECKNKKYLIKMLNEVEHKLKVLNDVMVDNPINPKALMYEEDLLKSEMSGIVKRLNYIDDTLNKVRDPKVRGMITDLWINGYSKTKTSIEYNFSERQLYRKIDCELKLIL